MDQDDDEAAMALWTERRLFPATHTLTGRDAARTGKTLLVRPTAATLRAQTPVSLDRAMTEQDWQDYTHERVRVEAEFGAGRAQTQAMVSDLRARTEALGLCLCLARDAGRLVGAIARFRLPAPNRHWARLQEVDVFPSWRGRGYGDAVPAAMFRLLHAEGTTMVVVGADEDDWPLNWYRTRGFHEVARVPLTR